MLAVTACLDVGGVLQEGLCAVRNELLYATRLLVLLLVLLVLLAICKVAQRL